MPSVISAPDLANAVSAFGTVLAGLLPLALSRALPGQPARWIFVYACILLTGIPTVWYHGFGETRWAGLADISTNLLLAWAIQFAALGDGWPARFRNAARLVSGACNGLMITAIVVLGPAMKFNFVPLGSFGGFTPGETLLILDCIFAVVLISAKSQYFSPGSRRVLPITVAFFLAGLLLATGSNTRVDFRILSWHAFWHIAGAFGFLSLWVYNQSRFVKNEIS